MDSSILSIIIPAFNEEQAIQQTLKELRKTPELKHAEIIVVDDGSTDQTAKRAASVPGIHVLRHKENIGYGAAIKTAVRASKRDFVCWYDADGQHRPENLVRLVQRVQEEDADWGLGIRGKDSPEILKRKLGKILLRLAVQIASRRKVADFNTGLRVFRTKWLVTYLHLLPNGFSASTTTTLLMIERGYRCAEVEIKTERRIGRSQVRLLRDGVRTLLLILRILLLFRAMLLFFIPGILMLLSGIIYSLWIMSINRMGFPIAGLLVIVTGVLTIFMSLIADQLSQMRLERFEDIAHPSYQESKGDSEP